MTTRVSVCPLCRSANLKDLYSVAPIPTIQHQVFADPVQARNAVTAEVTVTQCQACDYTFNSVFDPAKAVYTEQYQNEQANSPVFMDHLRDVMGLLDRENLLDGKVVEVGCGKAVFLQMLWDKGVDAVGYDVAYEGNDPRVIKEFFTQETALPHADLIVLRHTLEHIQNPFGFLRDMAAAMKNSPDCHIYIEVPLVEWIAENQSFWDVFYEHVNYFTMQVFANMFETCQQGTVFGGQYQYVIAKLSDLRSAMAIGTITDLSALTTMQQRIARYRDFVQSQTGLLLWGAGAKGVTFANITDADGSRIEAILDINPKKQNRYIGLSAHLIKSPDAEGLDLRSHPILIMNPNYENEIRAKAGDGARIYVLGSL